MRKSRKSCPCRPSPRTSEKNGGWDDLEESLGDLEEEFAFDADAGPSYAAPRLGVQGVRAAANTFAEE